MFRGKQVGVAMEGVISLVELPLSREDELTLIGLQQRRDNAGAPTGLDLNDMLMENRNRILSVLNGTGEDWASWRWQLAHRVSDVAVLSKVFPLTPDEERSIQEVGKRFRWMVSPYYLSLVDRDRYREDPVFRQCVPSILELEAAGGQLDPMNESGHCPAPHITRRYPDRLIINVTNQCASFCRHCQRRRHIGDKDHHVGRQGLQDALQYIRQHEEIRDVLVTGGDALLLPERVLDWLLTELDAMAHVEIKRLGTRVPVTLPQRITPSLVAMLKKHPPLYVNTQFNHPREITREAKAACDMLAEAGIVLGNQAVLLKGVNDDLTTMRRLHQQLLVLRVRPYYLFHAKEVTGTLHFRTSLETGQMIARGLRGYTSGLANPLYIINAPGGLGKVPLVPDSAVVHEDGTAVIRTWHGEIVEYCPSLAPFE